MKKNLTFYYYHIKDFIIKTFFKRDPIFNSLVENGFALIKDSYDLKTINYQKYFDANDVNFSARKIDLEEKDVQTICGNIKQNIVNSIKLYLGKNLYTYENCLKLLGNAKSTDTSWQPHHDGKGRRLRLFIWLNKKDTNTHPFYYLKNSHKFLKKWSNHSETKFRDLSNKMDFIYPDYGDILIFDTNLIHSNFKTTSIPRNVINCCFEAVGPFNRINKKNFEFEANKLNLIGFNAIKSE